MIQRMIEWTTGIEYLPLYHVDGKLNLSDLLTKKHDLTIEDLSIGSIWQTGHPWMRLDTVDIPLYPYQSLSITKDVEELIEEECFKDVSPPLEPLIPEMEIPGLSAGVSVLHSALPFPSPPMPGRMGVDLLIDPVSTGWSRSLRVLEHVIFFISKIQARIGMVKNVRSRFCFETDLEKIFF